MDEGLKRADLSYLPDEVAKAARQLVSVKYRIDMIGRSRPEYISGDLHGISTGGEFGPHFGIDFFCNIIPFLPFDWEVQPAEELLVPTAHTFGCSWRWWPDEYCDEDDDRKIRHHLFSDFGLKSTSYTFIPQLGLYCPSEGKNRVNFCRHREIEHIPARVYTHDYPEAKRLSLHVLNVAGGADVWAVLDQRYVQKVGHYDYALPLLRAYGATISAKWPAHWPSISDILANEMDCRDDSTFHNTVIDMKAVKDVLEKEKVNRDSGEQFVKTNLLNLPLKGMWRFLLLGTLLGFVGLATISFSGEGVAGDVALSLTAYVAGAISVVFAPLFWTKRKSLQT